MAHQEERTLGGETALGLLSNARRLHPLYYLREVEGVTRDRAARRIAAWEGGREPDAVDEDVRDRVAVSLAHDHPPRLADHDVVAVDLAVGEIERGAAVAGLESLLDAVAGPVDRSR